MAKFLKADRIDFASYMEASEPSVYVRKASAFADELTEAFAVKAPGDRHPDMFSTKLRNRIEFRPGEVTAWAGYNGHRKSMVTGQLALDLCVQRQRVLVVSLEMAPERTLARMARQAAAAERLNAAEIQRFTSWTNGRLWLFDRVGVLGPSVMLAVGRYFAQELRGTQLVIDSMMMVCESEEHLDEQKRFIGSCIALAQETGLHIHLVTHCRKPSSGDDSRPPSKYDIRGSGSITDQSHNVITVWVDRGKQKSLQEDPLDAKAARLPDMRLTVEKQRNGEFEGSVGVWWDGLTLRFTDGRVERIDPYAFMLPVME